MYKLAYLLTIFSSACFAQAVSYSMELSPTTPVYSNNGSTYGSTTVGGELIGNCTKVSYPHGLKFPPLVNQYTIDTGNSTILIGIEIPDGEPASCHNLITYRALGEKLSYINEAKTFVPGISAGVFSLDWSFNGKSYHVENWETIYCDLTDAYVDTITGPMPC